MRVKEVIKILESDGWQVRQKGSHRQFKHISKRGTVTVAGKLSVEIPTGTLIKYFQARTNQLKMKQYLVVIEQENKSFGAYEPDLPGCVAVGETQEEVSDLIK